MQQQILVPLDGSPASEYVLPHVASLAHATSSSVTLLHVIETSPSYVSWTGPTVLPPAADEQWEQMMRERTGKYLADRALRLHAGGIVTHTDVMVGFDVAAAIVDRADRDFSIGMVAMSTHARHGAERWLMGSVADRVLHATPVPMLVVRVQENRQTQQTVGRYNTIVVPLDGSLFAMQALSQARAIAERTDATIVLVAVAPMIDDIGLADGGIEPLWVVTNHQAADVRMAQCLHTTAKELKGAGFNVQTELSSGDPADAILAACEDYRADLLVMTTHGRSGLQRLWMGSVARDIVRSAALPVLLIRAKDKGQRGIGVFVHAPEARPVA